MNSKYVKDLILLLAIIVFCALAARHLAGHETLEDYANSHLSVESQENITASAAFDSNLEQSSSVTSSENTSGASISASESSTETVNSSVMSNSNLPDDSDVYDTRVTFEEGFYYEEIPDSIVSKITDVSYPHDCKSHLTISDIALSTMSILTARHRWAK